MTTDLHWLADHQPEVPAADPIVAASARDGLLEHIVISMDATAPAARSTVVDPRPVETFRLRPIRRRSRRPATRLVVRLVAAAAVTVLAATLAFGGGSNDPVEASPLMTLSAQVSRSGLQMGDATLVLRQHAFPDGSSLTGADLYLDDGTYYYAPTRDGLAARITAHQVEGTGFIGRERAAAIAALTLDADAARHGMARATVDPTDPPPSPPSEPLSGAAVEQLREKQAAGSDPKSPSTTWPPSSPAQLLDGMVWSNSLDALIAGAGQSEVRAGVLKLLATIHDVEVRSATVDGRAVLQITARIFPEHYVEQLVIDAATGVPVKFVGGTSGKPSSVVITYDVQRVTTADVARG